MSLFQLLLLLSLAVSCNAEQVRILVINSKTGRPSANQNVQIGLLGGPGLLPGEPVDGSRQEKLTDENGYVVFNISPEHPGLIVSFQQMCATKDATFFIETILTKGIVVKNYCWHRNSELERLKRRPGVLVLFADKLNFFEQWKHLRDAPGIP